MTWPTAEYVVGLAVLVRLMLRFCVPVTVAVAWFDVRPLPLAVATLVIEPASRSACVIVCVAVQLVVAPGASGPLPHGKVPSLSSVIEDGTGGVTVPGFRITYV